MSETTKMECLRLAMGFVADSASTPEMVVDTARIFYRFIEEDEKSKKKGEKEEKEKSKASAAAQPVNLDGHDAVRDEKIRHLLQTLRPDDRIVMRAILGRVETDKLEETFEEYRHKL